MLTPEQLSKHSLFSGADPQVLAAGLTGAYERTFTPGEEISSAGPALGLLLAGKARVTKAAGSAQLRMSELVPGSLLGGATLFEQGEQPTLITALVPCRALFFPQKVFEAMLEADFGLARRYMAYLTARIRFLAGRLESIACPSATDKVLNHLVQCADEQGLIRPAGGLDAMAETLGMGRATLYRALHALSEQGQIRREGRTICLLR